MGKGIIFFQFYRHRKCSKRSVSVLSENSSQESPHEAVQNGVSKAIQSCKALPVVKGRKRKNNTHDIKLLID